MKEIFQKDTELKNYYNWKLLMEGDSDTPSDEVMHLPVCEAEEISYNLHSSRGYDSILFETGPSTIHK